MAMRQMSRAGTVERKKLSNGENKKMEVNDSDK